MVAKSILIVDDEDEIRDSLKGILSDEGHRIVEAVGGKSALTLLQEERPDLVLLDIWMPEVDGIELLKEIKANAPDVEVIMISGHGNIHTAVTATKLGAFEFLEKPLSLDSVLLTVNRALQRKDLRDQSLKASSGPCKGEVQPVMTRILPGDAPTFRQRTLKKSVVLYGQGLHSGEKTGLILHPMPPGSGIAFSGISASESVPAHLDYVGSTGYATSLRRNGAVAKTVEHLLATLHCYRITNLMVKMHREVPIMDGSAQEFCQLIEEAGIQEEEERCSLIVIDRPFALGKRNSQERYISIEPAEGFEVCYTMAYPKPIGVQQYTFRYTGQDSFKNEIAPARTFGFLKEIEELEKMGLANGGRLDNCILVGDEKILNTELRFPDEFSRHKILDILGDFYLLGHPIRGRITARMTGHSDNVALLRKVQKGMKLC
jgi:UDP-3-O-acyl N-acetylglucosamine deacetylase